MIDTNGTGPIEADAADTGRWFSAAMQSRLDPYLQWADATGFRDYATSDSGCDRMPDVDRVIVAIELKAGVSAADLNRVLQGSGEAVHGVIPPAYLGATGARFITCALRRSAFQGATWAAIDALVERLNLALDLLPQRAVPRPPARPMAAAKTSPGSGRAGTNVVIGVIDTCFAFAHRDLRNQAGYTRIATLWDQDSQPAFASVPGRAPPEFGYGREVGRSELQALLNGYAVEGTTTSVHEDACYEACGYAELRRRFAHGTAVAAMIAGPTRVVDRLPKEPGDIPKLHQIGRTSGARSRADPPPGVDPDLVLVQLPRAAIQGCASHGLVAHVMDGLRYIVSRALPEELAVSEGKLVPERHVVVNLSFAYATGPHDGTSMLEAAMDALVQECAERGLRLDIVLPTGNTYLDRCHAQFTSSRDRVRSLTLAVPPGNEVSTFVEVWLPSAGTSSVSLRAPDGRSIGPVDAKTGTGVLPRPPGAPVPAAVIVSEGGSRGGVVSSQKVAKCMALIAIAPTLAFDDIAITAPAGRWEIVIDSDGPPGDVHAWIAFNQRNAGTQLRGRQARFVDDQWDPERYLRPALEDKVADCPIKRLGSISGIANGKKPVVVAGTMRRSRVPDHVGPLPGSVAVQLQARAHAFYSGARPEAKAAPNRFISAPCEESWALAGVPAAGSRSGSSVRARGTSFSAPQVVRYLVEHRTLPARGRLLRRTHRAELTGEGILETDD